MAQILVIDDLPLHAGLLLGLLKEQGHHAHTIDSEKGLANVTDYDLILLDIHLVCDNGFERSARLLDEGAKRVALYTYILRATDADWAAALGVSAVIAMPTTKKNLEQQVRQLLQPVYATEA